MRKLDRLVHEPTIQGYRQGGTQTKSCVRRILLERRLQHSPRFGVSRTWDLRTTIPAKATVMDSLALRLMTPASISSPTRNKNKARPIFATKERYGLDGSGNTCSVNPGIRPNAVGPSRIPPKSGSGSYSASVVVACRT